MSISKNDFQRALVFQGGRSLGAYEAGAYKATYELLTERDVQLGREGKPLFHIVAGTSIGALNAAVLISYVKENKSWRGSAERLFDFWEYMATESLIDTIPGFSEWWNYWRNYWHFFNNNLASSEWPEDIMELKSSWLKGCHTYSVPLKRLKIVGS